MQSNPSITNVNNHFVTFGYDRLENNRFQSYEAIEIWEERLM